MVSIFVTTVFVVELIVGLVLGHGVPSNSHQLNVKMHERTADYCRELPFSWLPVLTSLVSRQY